MAEKIYKKIDEIDFSMQSPDFIKETSSAKIVTAELYEREGYPVDGGLMDVRLGVIDPGLRCKTCGGNVEINSVEISYAFKLLMDELRAMGVLPNIKLKNKY